MADKKQTCGQSGKHVSAEDSGWAADSAPACWTDTQPPLLRCTLQTRAPVTLSDAAPAAYICQGIISYIFTDIWVPLALGFNKKEKNTQNAIRKTLVDYIQRRAWCCIGRGKPDSFSIKQKYRGAAWKVSPIFTESAVWKMVRPS